MRRKNKRTKEQVKQEAEHLAESLGLTLEELYHALVKDILLALQRTQGYNNDETMKLIRRFAEEGYIPKNYVDNAHDLLFSP